MKLFKKQSLHVFTFVKGTLILVLFSACLGKKGEIFPQYQLALTDCTDTTAIITGRFIGPDSLTANGGIEFEVRSIEFTGWFSAAKGVIKARGTTAPDGSFYVCVAPDKVNHNHSWGIFPIAPAAAYSVCNKYPIFPNPQAGDTIRINPRILPTATLRIMLSNPENMPKNEHPYLAVSWSTLPDSADQCVFTGEAKLTEKNTVLTNLVPARHRIAVHTMPFWDSKPPTDLTTHSDTLFISDAPYQHEVRW